MDFRIRERIDRVYLLYSHYKRMPRIFRGFNLPSYDGYSSKSKLTKVIDYLYIFFILKIMPNNYHLFRFDAKDRSQFKFYLGDTTEPIYCKKLRNSLWSHSILVHDKNLFKCLCLCHDLPIPRHYGILKDYKIDGNEIELYEFMQEKELEQVIVKPVYGGGGRGIHLITIDSPITSKQLEELDAHARKFMSEGYLIEEVLKQHPDLDQINPYTLNSIRIVTILCHDKSVEFLSAILKTNSTNAPMDNFSQGGIVIGIDLDTGRLKENGLMQYPQGRIFKQHPLTKTEFRNFQIPYWHKLKEIAVKAQEVFHYVKSVGWDIAITPEGPVIIEGNQDWGTNGIQAANGGLLTQRNKALFASYGITFYK